jgi:four helix bundle protein
MEDKMAAYQELKGHRDLKVFQLAYKLAMEIFEASKSFPKEEKYSLTDQIRRSSRSVAANIGEGFRKRQYPRMFLSKLADADGEATETQVWLDFSRDCEYLLHRKMRCANKRVRRGRQNARGYDVNTRKIHAEKIISAFRLPLSAFRILPTASSPNNHYTHPDIPSNPYLRSPTTAPPSDPENNGRGR